MSCPICHGAEREFGQAVVLRRHSASYVQCRSCGLVRVVEPHWLDEAYTDAIADRDIGLIGRNIHLAETTQRIIRVLFPGATRFLDFGAGNGMLVRLIRDAGYDFSYFDEHGPNLFAKGFDTPLPVEPAPDLVTAFEVLEHLPSPVASLAQAVSGSRGLIASTTLLPDPPPRPGCWWYYATGTGQHVTFFTAKAIEQMAERFGWHATSAGAIHLLSDRKVDQRVLRLLASSRLWGPLQRFGRRPSLLASDYERLTGERLDDPG